ncbi:hypothetical protein K402DRAFT_398000 [Aulographum hederae CBS 113979]|uniref:Ataxin-10 homolog n=1 Tax=Aulographum hederae CBS 113979 TaxID=1176131 RepID=A0A6G1GMB7_9PEZI|nr:hypothetical protein K402DRAFT_398000 [Aulographum hederae CBS 113979]
MDDDPAETKRVYATYLRLALQPLIVHFKSPDYIREDTVEMLQGRVIKSSLSNSAKQKDIREALGASSSTWRDLHTVITAAVPSLENRSLMPPGVLPNEDPDDGPGCGYLIARNSTSLLRDLDALNDLVAIARNVLTVGERAQDLAAKSHFDQAIFKLVGICVKVTARGFDGDAGSMDEERWQAVVNDYKKLLITSLQFLNNLVTQNERRKLMLWVDLFDSSTEGVLGGSHQEDIARKLTMLEKGDDRIGALRDDLEQVEIDSRALAAIAAPKDANGQPKEHQASSSPFLLYIGKVGMEIKRELIAKGEKASATDIASECSKRWQHMSAEEKSRWNDMYAELLTKYREELTSSPHNKNKESVAALARSINQLQQEVNRLKVSVSAHAHGTASESTQKDIRQLQLENAKGKAQAAYDEISSSFGGPTDMNGPPPAAEADYRMSYDAAYGADILQRGKDDLMKRLETYPERVPTRAPQAGSQSSPVMSPSSPDDWRDNPPPDDLSDEESEDDFVVPGDDGRGLLTDVPLILGPSEIEVLPMIILSGIVPPMDPSMPGYGATPEEILAIKNMHTVRCHLLLAQDNGRNLLRELLIFVAAWDLREEELYFKFMVKIMEAILNNGLMPFSYHAFRENKDIISPAQAVIMKLLTAIFRARQSPPKAHPTTPPPPDAKPPSPYPTRVDVHMVNFLLTEFRRHIIPQTCALIFLQGQIRAGAALPDDFPLNLWDMERMYEGVYQYLEFFAILTERDIWKDMMGRWEIASELVTLLQELESAIPKVGLKSRRPPRPPQQQPQPDELFVPQPGEQQDQRQAPPAPIAVERPYDVAPSAQDPPLPPSPSSAIPGSHTSMYNLSPPPSEPSDFPWKNLKKLTVLVLSSLTFRSTTVQDQIRNHAGIEAVLNCTKYDEHNPYIKEHAVMCIRFLVEGNKANADVVKALQPKGTVDERTGELVSNQTPPQQESNNATRKFKAPPPQSAAASGVKGLPPSQPILPSQGQSQATSSSSKPPPPPVAAPTNPNSKPTPREPPVEIIGPGSSAAKASMMFASQNTKLPDWMEDALKEVPGGQQALEQAKGMHMNWSDSDVKKALGQLQAAQMQQAWKREDEAKKLAEAKAGRSSAVGADAASASGAGTGGGRKKGKARKK